MNVELQQVIEYILTCKTNYIWGPRIFPQQNYTLDMKSNCILPTNNKIYQYFIPIKKYKIYIHILISKLYPRYIIHSQNAMEKQRHRMFAIQIRIKTKASCIEHLHLYRPALFPQCTLVLSP